MRRRGILSGESAEEMWGVKKRKAEETDIDVTPLVDCVFLLLSFFMMTSPMKGNPDRNVPAADHGIGVDPNGSDHHPHRRGGAAPKILLDNRESTLEDVRPFVEAGIRKGRYARRDQGGPKSPSRPGAKGGQGGHLGRGGPVFPRRAGQESPRNDVTRWRFVTTAPTAANC